MLFYIMKIGAVKAFYTNYFFQRGDGNKYTILCQTPINIDPGIGVHPHKSGFTSVPPDGKWFNIAGNKKIAH